MSELGCGSINVVGDMKSLGAFVVYSFLVRGHLASATGDPLGEVLRRYVNELAGAHTLQGLKDDPVIRAYRDFYWRLGIDPTKTRPSSEALARRALRGEFPRVSPLVDAGNIASLRTLVPIGIYDLDLLRLPLSVTLSRGGMKFLPIGGGELALPDGYPVMVDSTGTVVHMYSHRDSALTSVRGSTRRALVVGAGVPGVQPDLVSQAVELTIQLAGLVGWRREGPICHS